MSAEHSANAQPWISVVVATYNRPARLAALLQALARQTLALATFEVIVVDDASPASPLAVVDRLRAKTSLQVRLIIQPHNGGPARARNAGTGQARAPIVAFTDDDCVPAPGWLAALLQSFADPAVAGAEGPVTTDETSISARTHQVRNQTPGAFFTANAAYRRAMFVAGGGFDELFPYPHAEDIDLGLRMQLQGPIVYCREAAVYHPVVPIGLVAHARKVRYNLSDVRLFLKHPSLRRKPEMAVWRYAARNVIVHDLKLMRAVGRLLPWHPWRWLEYMAYHGLRLTFTLLLVPQYRREEAVQRRLLAPCSSASAKETAPS
jgi:glycosyltransferase involved in cell wall biosynthesis